MADAKTPAARPLSPHLSIYKMTMVMVMSGLHRITGMFLYIGTILLVAYLLALAGGKESYAWASWFFGSFIGKFVLFGYTWTLFHHMLGGVRHYLWDIPWGLDGEKRHQLAVATLIGSLALTAITWIAVLVR